MASAAPSSPATVLLTGAAGYIASHTWLALQDAGYAVVGVDDFSNSSPEVLNRLKAIGGQPPEFVQASVCDAAAMEALFAARRIDAVVHFEQGRWDEAAAITTSLGLAADSLPDAYADALGWARKLTHSAA